MKFGNINEQELNQVDFCLPADNPENSLFLAELAHSHQPIAGYIGCSVWTDQSFVGKIYPPSTPTQDYLKLYSKQFNAVELNATFYSIPSSEQIKKWQSSVEPGFKFCPKVPRSISHSNQLSEQLKLLDYFLDRIQGLEENLGITFLQLPEYFQPTRMQDLQQLLAHIPPQFPCAVEFRNPAWFSDAFLQQEVIDLLKKQGMSTVISDVAGRRDVLHQVLTTNSIFVRFKGYPTESNNYSRLDAWVARLKKWLEKGLKQIYFMVHETDKAFCIDLAIYLAKAFHRQTPLNLPVPRLVAQQGYLF